MTANDNTQLKTTASLSSTQASALAYGLLWSIPLKTPAERDALRSLADDMSNEQCKNAIELAKQYRGV
jgi:hypothetical protein